MSSLAFTETKQAGIPASSIKNNPRSPEMGTDHHARRQGVGPDFGQIAVHSPMPITPTPIGIQPKLTVNQPGDRYEQEADAIADRVVRMTKPSSVVATLTTPSIQRKCAKCDNQEKHIQRKETTGAAPANTANYVSNLSGGRPLTPTERSYFEPRMGHDFSRVRIHTDAQAASSARSVSARAYTHGNNIVFGSGQYQPESEAGKRLMAHELVHTVQQGEGGGMATEKTRTNPFPTISSSERQLTRTPSDSFDIYEEDRKKMASQLGIKPTTTDTPKKIYWLGQKPSESLQQAAELASWQQQHGLPIKLTPDEAPGSDKVRMALSPYLPRTTAVTYQPGTARRPPILPTVSKTDREILLEHAHSIQTITPLATKPGFFSVWVNGTQHELTQVQVDSIYQNIREAIRASLSKVERLAQNAQGKYDSFSKVNDNKKFWMTSRAVRLFGAIQDPGPDLVKEIERSKAIGEKAIIALDANNFVQAATYLADSEGSAQSAHLMQKAYFEGTIGAGELQVKVLEFTSAASFAIAGSIGVIVAAPLVAGYGAGLGLTGGWAAAFTIGGTGTVVGGGTAIAKGGAAFLGNAFTGESWETMTHAGWEQGMKGFREGFITGAAGGAGRVLAPALGVGIAGVGNQLTRRMASEAIVNGTASTVDALFQGRSLNDAVSSGLISAGTSLPAALVGGSSSPLARTLVAGGSAYISARAQGLSPEETMHAVQMAVVIHMGATAATSRGSSGEDARRDAALTEQGQRAGAQHRAAVRRPGAASARPATSGAAPPTTAPNLVPNTPVNPSDTAPPTTAPVGQFDTPDIAPASTRPQLRRIEGNGAGDGVSRGRLRAVPSETEVTSHPLIEHHRQAQPANDNAVAIDAVGEQLPLAAGAERQQFRASASAGGPRRPSTGMTIVSPSPHQSGGRPTGSGGTRGPIRGGSQTSPRRIPFANDPDFKQSILEEQIRPGVRTLQPHADEIESHPTLPTERPEGDLFERTQDEIDAANSRRERGNTFNTDRERVYPHNEVWVEHPTTGKRVRVDSYVPNREIISRKYPEGGYLDTERGVGYIVELVEKYPSGAIISNVPTTRAAGLAGQPLRGRLILEVPVLTREVPKELLDFASRNGVTIRDETGRVYQ